MNLDILNQPQRQAVTADLGPVLVLAGAGSGKTRVLTYRIAYLIEQGMMPADKILAVTFTNKAAKEMQTRINKLLTSNKVIKSAGQPSLGTFHSIGARILRHDIANLGYTPNFVIFDSDDTKKILVDILKELDVPKQYGPGLFKAYISGAKNLLQSPSQMDLGLEGNFHNMVQEVYIRYQNFLVRQNALDFDDLLMLPIKLFENFPEVLRKYQTKWQYILVDEYQDTNQAQYMFLHLLAKNKNLFVVGDDAQSIYGFRGSNIANILNFEKDFGGSLVIKLEQNYRSTKNILAAAQKVIELNSEQKPKSLWTDNNSGERVIIKEAYDGRDEARYVAKKIIKLSSPDLDNELEYEVEQESTSSYSILDHFLKKNNQSYGSGSFLQLPSNHSSLKEFAVLYRTHAQSRQLEEVFISAGIPYQIIGGVKFYERREIKDVISFLRLISNPQDLLSIKRVINLPPRGLGPKAVDQISNFILSLPNGLSHGELATYLPGLGLPAKQKTSVNDFFATLHKCTIIPAEATLSELLKVILKQFNIESIYTDGTDDGENRKENIKELVTVTAKFDNQNWQESLPVFLEEVALITDLDTMGEKGDSVTMMTLHAAKGLEFDTVFFVGLEEGILPHSQSLLSASDLAEEVRLAYVGLTRARQRLFLLYAQSRQIYGSTQASTPSRILQALPSDAVKYDGPVNNLLSSSEDGELSYEPF